MPKVRIRSFKESSSHFFTAQIASAEKKSGGKEVSISKKVTAMEPKGSQTLKNDVSNVKNQVTKPAVSNVKKPPTRTASSPAHGKSTNTSAKSPSRAEPLEKVILSPSKTIPSPSMTTSSPSRQANTESSPSKNLPRASVHFKKTNARRDEEEEEEESGSNGESDDDEESGNDEESDDEDVGKSAKDIKNSDENKNGRESDEEEDGDEKDEVEETPVAKGPAQNGVKRRKRAARLTVKKKTSRPRANLSKAQKEDTVADAKKKKSKAKGKAPDEVLDDAVEKKSVSKKNGHMETDVADDKVEKKLVVANAEDVVHAEGLEKRQKKAKGSGGARKRIRDGGPVDVPNGRGAKRLKKADEASDGNETDKDGEDPGHGQRPRTRRHNK